MIIASNFKTNHTRASTQEYMAYVERFMEENGIKDDVYLFPTATSLQKHDGKIVVGAQNAYPVDKGSFTGEIGTEQLDEFGIRSILIGHSERRHVLGEQQELMTEKFEFFKERGYTITYCIGEPLEVREEGLEAVLNYMEHQMAPIDATYEKLIVAYEPVWAIGTGVTATLEDIKATHDALKSRYNLKSLLYGGSVKVDNCASILQIESVDGVLIGTASWKQEDFCEILKQSKEIQGV